MSFFKLESSCRMDDAETNLYRRYAEDIGLLHVLGRVPLPPLRNVLPDDDTAGDAARLLTLQAEKKLVTTLAFLSSAKKDSNRVTAVCAQEKDRGRALTVLLAANAAGPTEPTYLKDVKAGFDRIIDIMRTKLEASRDENASDVLRAIIKMCRTRILERARLSGQSDRIKEKLPVQQKLLQVIDALNNCPPKSRSSHFRSIAHDIVTKMDDFEHTFPRSSTGPSEEEITALKKIICGFHRLEQLPDLEDLLMKVPAELPSAPEEGMRRALLGKIRKMSRYSVVAKWLVALARENRAIRRLTTQIVVLEPKAYERPKTFAQPASLEDVLRRIRDSFGFSFESDRLISELHKLTKLQGGLQQQFAKMVRSVLCKSKIHAEVQLLAYLDRSEENSPRPRIIAANKDACYLCNAFVSFYGSYHIPGSHQRIYHEWRLPACGLAGVNERFADELEKRAVDRIGMVLRGEAKKLIDPVESNVSLAVSSQRPVSTVLSSDVTERPAGMQTISRPPVTTVAAPRKDSGVVMDLRPELPKTMQEEDHFVPSSDEDSDSTTTAVEAWQSVSTGQALTLQLSDQLRVTVEYEQADVSAQQQHLAFRVLQTAPQHEYVDEYDVEELFSRDSSDTTQCRRGCRCVGLRLGHRLFYVELSS